MTQKAEDIINAWLQEVGAQGVELTLSTLLPNGHTIHVDFYPMLLMNLYHMYLWYDYSIRDKTEWDINQAFMRDGRQDWEDMRDDILQVYSVDLEDPIWEKVGSRP